MSHHGLESAVGTEKPRPKVIVGGVGTGGHYFPAVVVANELQERRFDVVFLARKGFVEETVAHQYGVKTFSISPRPFYGKSLIVKFLFVFSLIYSIYRLHAMTRHAIGLAFGGFGAVPLAISCMINRSVFYIFEPNRVPGKATQRFAARAKRVFLGLPLVKNINAVTAITGVPIRREFLESLNQTRSKALRGAVSILFYGGSQGAQRLNDLALELQKIMPEKWFLTIIAGDRDYARIMRAKGERIRVIPFTEKPWQEIRQADLIISRAGALAGYEILALNKKVIWIPFPYAIDDHQFHNALYFAKLGDALVQQEIDLTADSLARCIGELLRKKRKQGTRIIRDAEKRIVDYMLQDRA